MNILRELWPARPGAVYDDSVSVLANRGLMGFSREKFAVEFGASLHIDRLSARALDFAVLDDDFSTSQDDVVAYWFLVHDSHQEELEKHVVVLKEDLFFFLPSIEVARSIQRKMGFHRRTQKFQIIPQRCGQIVTVGAGRVWFSTRANLTTTLKLTG
jgi:hypothetical protein